MFCFTKVDSTTCNNLFPFLFILASICNDDNLKKNRTPIFHFNIYSLPLLTNKAKESLKQWEKLYLS